MKRNISLDILKGLAIIAVILYHLGISAYGYLGVDLFFVISGFLATAGLVKNFSEDRFSYWKYLNKRVSRLWPGLVLISAVSLILGWLLMMPLHFKLDCESVIGTLTYTNNFVQYITGGDYWTSANEFKPLMHTWYIGILMQFYVIIPVIFIITKRYTHQWLRNSVYLLAALTLLSLFLYVSQLMTESQDFYMLPSRFFELGAGGLLAIVCVSQEENVRSMTRPLCFSMLLVFASFLMFGSGIGDMKLRLVVTVALSIAMVGYSNYFSISPTLRRILSPISFLGVASYSLYLSHQVFFAFYRYAVNSVFTLTTYLWILAATIAVGILLYYLFEKPISSYISKKRNNLYIVNIICVAAAIPLSVVSFYYYRQNGLVRDIPELSLYVGENRQTPEEYNHAPHGLNKDFEKNGRKNIFIIGDSFGRDWANILCEAGVDSVMNISYTMYADENTAKRLSEADYVFVATFLPFFSSYNYDEIYPELFNREFYRVGLKTFGDHFIGNIYNRRNSDSYYDTTVYEKDFSKDINTYEQRLFGSHFIDMMEPIKEKDGSIRLFTDDRMLISEDGIHLTKAGAQLYAEKLDVWKYLD